MQISSFQNQISLLDICESYNLSIRSFYNSHGKRGRIIDKVRKEYGLNESFDVYYRMKDSQQVYTKYKEMAILFCQFFSGEIGALNYGDIIHYINTFFKLTEITKLKDRSYTISELEEIEEKLSPKFPSCWSSPNSKHTIECRVNVLKYFLSKGIKVQPLLVEKKTTKYLEYIMENLEKNRSDIKVKIKPEDLGSEYYDFFVEYLGEDNLQFLNLTTKEPEDDFVVQEDIEPECPITQVENEDLDVVLKNHGVLPAIVSEEKEIKKELHPPIVGSATIEVIRKNPEPPILEEFTQERKHDKQVKIQSLGEDIIEGIKSSIAEYELEAKGHMAELAYVNSKLSHLQKKLIQAETLFDDDF